MRTKIGPNYRNLFVVFLEKQIFEQYIDPTPDYLDRFIDVCVGTASCSRSRCGMLYIGETGRQLRTRFGEHCHAVSANKRFFFI